MTFKTSPQIRRQFVGKVKTEKENADKFFPSSFHRSVSWLLVVEITNQSLDTDEKHASSQIDIVKHAGAQQE